MLILLDDLVVSGGVLCFLPCHSIAYRWRNSELLDLYSAPRWNNSSDVPISGDVQVHAETNRVGLPQPACMDAGRVAAALQWRPAGVHACPLWNALSCLIHTAVPDSSQCLYILSV